MGESIEESGRHTLSVRVVHDEGTVRLVPVGDVDMASANTFDTVAEQVLRAHPDRVELDMTDVQFIDSSGLRSILVLRNQATAEGVELRVTGLSPAAERILELTGLIEELRNS